MRFLQFSDIHFTREVESDVFALDRELQWGVRAVLRELAPIHAILVCGDIAFSGKPTEYAVADKFLRDVCGGLGIPPEMVFVVPGNHDIDREVTNSNPQRAIRAGLRNAESAAKRDQSFGQACRDADKGSLLLAPLAAYNRFAAQYGCRTAADHPCWDYVVEVTPEIGLALRGLNSVLVSYEHDNKTDERLLVGTGQCILEPETNALYLTLCHHPPEWLLDREALKRRFDRNVAIQVSGHDHRFSVKETSRGIAVRAGALQPNRLETHWDPRFCVVEVTVAESQSEVTIQPWRWSKDLVFAPQAEKHYKIELPPERLDSPARQELSAARNRRRLLHHLAQLSMSDALLAAEAAGLSATIADAVAEDAVPAAILELAAGSDALAKLWDEVRAARGQGKDPDNPFS